MLQAKKLHPSPSDFLWSETCIPFRNFLPKIESGFFFGLSPVDVTIIHQAVKDDFCGYEVGIRHTLFFIPYPLTPVFLRILTIATSPEPRSKRAGGIGTIVVPVIVPEASEYAANGDSGQVVKP